MVNVHCARIFYIKEEESPLLQKHHARKGAGIIFLPWSMILFPSTKSPLSTPCATYKMYSDLLKLKCN